MIIAIRARLKIVETELVSTIAARHVIAPLVFIHCDRAFGAIDGSGFFFPLLKLYIFLSLATLIARVRLHSARKANASHALFTDHIFLVFFGILAHIALARCLGAPSQGRV